MWVTVLFAGPALAKSAIHFKADLTSKVEVKALRIDNQSEYEVRTVDRTFTTVQAGDRWLLLEKQVDQTFSTYLDFERGKVRVAARDLRAPGKPLFLVEQPGTIISVQSPFLAIGTAACCASQDGSAVFSLLTGKLLVFTLGAFSDFSHPALTHIVAPGLSRTVGVHTSNASNAGDVYDNDRLKGHFLALLSYASDEACLSRLLLERECPDPKRGDCFEVWVDHLEWKTTGSFVVDKRTGDLQASGETKKPAQIRDVALQVFFSDKTTAVFPIAGDTFDATHALLPPNTTVTDVGCGSPPYGHVAR